LTGSFGWNGIKTDRSLGAKVYIAAQVNPLDPFHPKHPSNPSFLMPAEDT